MTPSIVVAFIVVAFIVAAPPTLFAALVFLAARTSDRIAAQEGAATVAQSLETLQATVSRVESAVERVEAGVVELCERVARIEGAQAVAHPVHGG